MTDWFGSRSHRAIYRRVRWPSWEEAEDYQCIKGGSIELSALSDLKASGSLSFIGETPESGDLIRIYYKIGGELYPMATMFASCEEPTLSGKHASGSIELTSVLTVLSKAKPGRPYTVSAGTFAVDKAAEIAEGMGLRVNNPAKSSYALRDDHTFEQSDSWLAIVNWLLDAAGYASCCPDAYGVVQMAPYIEPTERSVSWTFADDEKSIMLPDVKLTRNLADTPNVCRLWHETEEESIWASCSNVDQDSPVSLPNIGMERTMDETVSELPGETQEERVSNLMAMSERRLIDNSADIEYVEVSHPWVPIAPNDAIAAEYVSAGLSWRGAITNMRFELTGAFLCATKARRFVRTAFETVTEGGAA